MCLWKLGNRVPQVLWDAPLLRSTDQHLLDIQNIDEDKKGMYLHHWLRAIKVTTEQ